MSAPVPPDEDEEVWTHSSRGEGFRWLHSRAAMCCEQTHAMLSSADVQRFQTGRAVPEATGEANGDRDRAPAGLTLHGPG